MIIHWKWQIDRETVANFIFLGSKITADDDCKTYTEESRKTTRPFKYDLNQISYDYTVEVTNRLKGLDLIDRRPEELCMEVF